MTVDAALELGSFEFGGTTTLIDPRITGNRNPELTFVHEEAHRDLVSMTIYGYVLSRLNDMSKLDVAAERNTVDLLQRFIDGFWRCAEGSATAIELVAARGKLSPADVEKLVTELPLNYQSALRIFRPIADKSLYPLPAPIGVMLQACLINMIAETAADWAIFTSKTPLPDHFWALVGHLLAGRLPDSALPKLAQKTANIPMAIHGKALDAAKAGITDKESSQLILLGRNLIRETKSVLLGRCGIDPAAQVMLHDANRILFISGVDSKLQEDYPSLPRVTRSAGVVGPEVHVKVREPFYLLPNEHITAQTLPQRYLSLAEAPGFRLFVNEFLLPVGADIRTLMSKPIHITPAGLDCASPYLICRSAPADTFRFIEECRIEHIWLTPGIELEPSRVHDSLFIRSLRAPVYLSLEVFSWERARRLLGEPAKPCKAGIFAIGPQLELAVAALQDGSVTVFGIATTNFPDDLYPGQRTNRTFIREDPLLGSAALIVLHSSRANALL